MSDLTAWRATLSRFRAPLWAWLVTAAAIALFLALGTWQLRRGFAKEELVAQLASADGTPIELSGQSKAPEEGSFQRAQANGLYLAAYQLLQDGQSHQEKPGYHVWTPLRLMDGNVVLVNRGWVPQPADLNTPLDLPAPGGIVTVDGWWRSLPEPGVRLGGNEPCRPAERYPAVVVYPTAEKLECLLGQRPLPGLLLQDPRMADGFVREWTVGGTPAPRHFGYAVQWYAFAIGAAVLFFVVNRRREP